MIRSLRLRLTVWYLAFFSLLFIVFSIFLYGVLSHALQDRLDDTLASQSAIAGGLLEDELGEMHGDTRKAASEVVAEMGGSELAIFSGKELLASTAAVPTTGLNDIAGQSPTAIISLAHLGRYGSRASVHRMTTAGQTYVIAAIGPLDSIAGELDVVRRVLLIALPILLALAGFGGYGLATRSLAPVGSMAEQARRITGSNLHTRLEIGNAAEELTVLAESFNELLARLDQSFESMRRFVADASHELRTPISVIRGEADVALSSERSSADYRESLAIILDESRRLSRLVDDLLNLARADAGHVNLHVEEFYFNDLVSECCRSVQRLAAARDIHLECRCGDDVSFRGDEQLIRRLVLNLLDNAIRYTPPGGRVVAELEANAPDLRLRVSDTGMGIAPESAPHVFERFFRGDKARSREDGGFGLGLSIVKWIAESHNGRVDLVSRPDEGSTFSVSFPMPQQQPKAAREGAPR